MEAHAADRSAAVAEDDVAASFEARIRAREGDLLSPRATPSYPAQREREEAPCRLRTPFQRDRDRIVHSKSFRRLAHKTQVFIAPEGDHYRTRLTHTLETCGISRTVARTLRLNEDLTEAIGVGHDLGHPPFGHAGEEALDRLMHERFGRRFHHNEQSLRVVERLERDGTGLNLTAPVRDGILKHTGPDPPATVEGRIVRLVDRIAYINHDIDDTLRAGVLTEADLPREELSILGATGSQRIDLLVHDLVEHSERAGDIAQGEEVGGAMARLRKFMFDNVYLGEASRQEQSRVAGVIEKLLDHYLVHPDALPPAPDPGDDLPTRVTDYLAGMTDRFCIRDFERLAVPREFYVSRVTSESVEAVRQAADIVEVISGYTDLRRQGVRHTGLCPFHDERTPSFSVDSSEGLYYCFGCQAGGDVFRFLMEKEGLEFREAVEQLSDRYGVELAFDSHDPGEEQRRRGRERLLALLSKTARFYERYLWDSGEAQAARSYLEGRGLEQAALEEFGVGFAPSAWDRLLVRAQRDGFNVKELHDAGLAQRGRGGGTYDRFRGRIMFPLRDTRGRVLGFGARALREGQEPKYVNSPETSVYRKGRSLFGIDLARQHATRTGRVIVVEGYTDVIALHQAGIRNVVASMGTALTDEQVAELARLARTVLLAFDADRSGREAMLRVQRAARGRGVDLKVIPLPDDKDPCDLLLGEGSEVFAELEQRAVSFLQFQVQSAMEGANVSSAADKDRLIAELGPVFADAEPSAERDEQIRNVASRLDLSQHLLEPLLSRPRATGSGTQAPQRRGAERGEQWERIFLAMCVSSGSVGREYLLRLEDDHLTSDLLRRARDWIVEHFGAPTAGLSRDDEQLASVVSEIVVRASSEPENDSALEIGFLGMEDRRLERAIRAAVETQDFDLQRDLSARRREVIESRARLMSEADRQPSPRSAT